MAVVALASVSGLDHAWRGASDDTLRAVIVDQLSATAPNPAFAEDVTGLLEENGYEVKYYSGDEVTIDLYRHLPAADPDLLVLRTHSTAVVSRGEEDLTSVSLFTNQPYEERGYLDEQLAGRIGFAQYRDGGPMFFGITADFVRHGMDGDFDGTVVVGMGCQGLLNDLAAEAFQGKGAASFVGWDGLVSATHTDEATEALLRHYVLDGAGVGDAVRKTMQEIGPDPDFGSALVSRP